MTTERPRRTMKQNYDGGPCRNPMVSIKQERRRSRLQSTYVSNLLILVWSITQSEFPDQTSTSLPLAYLATYAFPRMPLIQHLNITLYSAAGQ